MVEVILLFQGEKNFYVSKKVLKTILEDYTFIERDTGKEVNTVLKELKNLSLRGFPRNHPKIRSEGKGKAKTKGAYCVWVNRNLRIAGFYEFKGFIGIDLYIKKTQKNTKRQTKILEKVAKVKNRKDWNIVDRNELWKTCLIK